MKNSETVLHQEPEIFTVNFAIHNGIHWLGVHKNTKKKIRSIPLRWGAGRYPVGTSFDRLGQNGRSSLDIKVPFVFSGFIDVADITYVLFDLPEKTGEQLPLFESDSLHWFIAPIFVNHMCLLMCTSKNGFYDIRP